jgi:DeoR family transcriptional regulator of aga operon
MDRYARLNALLELLTERGRLDIDAVAVELDVSPATIRRDFDHLAEQQLVTRTRGGAVSNSVSLDLPLRYKVARHPTEKQRIGKAGAALLRPGMVVGLTGGTTTTEVARAMAARGDLTASVDDPSVTLVTNAVNIANELAIRPQIRIVVTGGVARPQSYELIGPLAEHMLGELSLDIVFLGVNAVDPEFGASTFHEGEAGINALMVRQARRVVVVADSSKLGQRSFVRICPASEIDLLVTDDGAARDVVTAFEKAGIEVLRV